MSLILHNLISSGDENGFRYGTYFIDGIFASAMFIIFCEISEISLAQVSLSNDILTFTVDKHISYAAASDTVAESTAGVYFSFISCLVSLSQDGRPLRIGVDCTGITCTYIVTVTREWSDRFVSHIGKTQHDKILSPKTLDTIL